MPVRCFLYITVILLFPVLNIALCTAANPPDQNTGDDNNVIEILYYSNLNGNVENCRCGTPPLGGLSKIITIVKAEKKENPNLLFIDGGDFLNTYPFPELNRSILKSYSYFTPDLLTPGDQEFIPETSFTLPFFRQNRERIVLTNAFPDSLRLRKMYEKKISGRSITILGYLDSSAFYYGNRKPPVKLDEMTFRETYDGLAKGECVMVLFHGSEKAMKRFRYTYPKITLILFAHEQSSLIVDDIPPFVVGGGADGEFLRHIFLDFAHKQPYISVKQYPVYENIDSDTTVEAFIEEYRSALK